MSEYFGKEVPKLGFGLMRLPRKLLATDVEQVKTMVDRFMEAGFTYFDTAFVYPGSEPAIRKALVERYPRESFTLATKLNAMLARQRRRLQRNSSIPVSSARGPGTSIITCSTRSWRTTIRSMTGSAYGTL